MISNEELYGTDDVPAVDKRTVDIRLKLLNSRKGDILKKPNTTYNVWLLTEIEKAVEFWTILGTENDI